MRVTASIQYSLLTFFLSSVIASSRPLQSESVDLLGNNSFILVSKMCWVIDWRSKTLVPNIFSFERKSPQSLLILVHRSWWNLDHAFSLCRVQLVALDASWSMPSIILNSVAVNSKTVALSASSCDWILVTSHLPNSCSFLQMPDLRFKSFCASAVVIECFRKSHDGDADLTRQFYEYHYVSNPFPPHALISMLTHTK